MAAKKRFGASRKCPSGNVLLPRMYWKNGAYWHVRRNRWQRLGATYANALRRYSELETPCSTGWADLVELTYRDIASDHAAGKLKANTVDQYDRLQARLIAGFRELEPHEITQKHVRAFLEYHRNTPNVRNRMLTVLRKIFEKGANLDACDFNPAHGVPRLEERKRKRLLELGEFFAIRSQANAHTALIMDMCYLTAQRIGDVLAIEHSQIKPDGIYFVQQKTGKRLVVATTPELEATVRSAKALRRVMCRYLFHPRGKATPYAYRSIKDNFDRAAQAAGVADCTLHDIRAMALTHIDAAGGDATALAGHHSRATTERYIRDRRTTQAKGPSLRYLIDSDGKTA
jgi:integrase